MYDTKNILREGIMERKSGVSGRSKWQVEAKRRLAKWRQQLSMARALAHGDIVVEVAAKKGMKISVDGSGLKECMESSSFKEIQAEAARRLSTWDENMNSAEDVVYGSFLVSAAREAGVDVDGLMKLPMLAHEMKKDVSIQVSVPCPECELMEKSVMEGMGEEVSFSDSEEEDSASEK